MTDKERGHAIEWGWIQAGSHRGIGYTSNVDEKEVERCLHADAIDVLPQGTRYELRKRASTNYGRTNGMAWYHSPDMILVLDPAWNTFTPGYHAELGCSVLGRYTTPIAPLPVVETHGELK